MTNIEKYEAIKRIILDLHDLDTPLVKIGDMVKHSTGKIAKIVGYPTGLNDLVTVVLEGDIRETWELRKIFPITAWNK